MPSSAGRVRPATRLRGHWSDDALSVIRPGRYFEEVQTTSSTRWPASALVVTIVLALLLLATGVWGIYAAGRLSRLRSEVDALESDLREAQDRIDGLEADLEASRAGNGGNLSLEELLGGLFGDPGGDSGTLEDLLGGLLGDGDLGNLGDLFGESGSSSDLAGCLVDAPGQFEISQASLGSQVEDIADAIEEVRGLSFPSEITPVFVTPEEMSIRVRDLATESYPPERIDFDRRLLVALRMIEPGYDLLDAQLDLLDSGVAGYYDPEGRELVVATSTSREPLPAIDQVTLAHELIHALTDARLEFPPALEDPAADPDEARAVQALVEGDATLGMQQFSLGALDLADQLGMVFDPRILGAQQEAGEFPYVLSNGLQFPYLDGMNFVCSLFSSGGWEAVDQAYDLPPSSSAEILFPERYAAGVLSEDPDPPGLPGSGWELLREANFGAADLLVIFSAPGDDVGVALSDPRERARAWAGGRATVWTKGAESAVGVTLVDNGEGIVPLCDSMTEWTAAAFSKDAADQTAVVCDGPQVRVGIAPNGEIAHAVAAGPS